MITRKDFSNNQLGSLPWFLYCIGVLRIRRFGYKDRQLDVKIRLLHPVGLMLIAGFCIISLLAAMKSDEDDKDIVEMWKDIKKEVILW